jgi:predicted ribosome quality control (RQC) complex YloA/Tae2 family protein
MNIKEHLELIKNEINDNFKDSFLNKTQQLSGYDFLFGFSKGKNKNLIVSINLNSPFVLVSEDKFLQNENDVFFQHLKTKLFNAYFKEATILNDDNILCLKFMKTTDAYDKIPYDLVIELFKSNTNMIILSNGKIEEAFKYKGIDTHHPILNNMNYDFPERTLTFKEFTDQDEKRIKDYYSNINTKYLEEKYKDLITLLKRKKKSLTKKYENLKIEKEEAINHQSYKDYGDYLKMNFNNVKKGDSELKVDDIIIPLKTDYTPSQNLQYFYKVYKKSKATIEATNKYLNETQNEIQYIENILSTIDSYSEDEYSILINELTANKLIKITQKKGTKFNESAKRPYFVVYNNVRFGYGKNNVQNDQLTFKYASKNDWFLHISMSHGPHIIIFKNNPSDDEIEFACELALYLAKVSDGDVIYSQVKELKKTANLGQVKLGKYETYHIAKIRPEMKEYINKSSRL